MVVKEQSGHISDSAPPTGDEIPLDLGSPTTEDIQLKEQSTAGDEFAPKVRKPYTITKQRERWAEEEHSKFLEALKLYGRAWRRIEEHVGTKTAVQIRSHAQKFFSKVVRESKTCGGTPVKPIEIPPPRPKRKPMHPYPRKLVSPVKTNILIPEKAAGLACLSMFGHEYQSPTSVLTAVGSGSFAAVDSCMTNGSPSSVSSSLSPDTIKAFGSEACKLLSEDVISYGEDEISSTDGEMPSDLDLSSQNTGFVKGDLNESAMQRLKLFGKMLLVDPQEQSCSFPSGVMPLRSAFSEIKNDVACSTAPFLWLTLRSNSLDSTQQVLSPIPVKAQSLYAKKEKLDDDAKKEGSSTGSNADSVGDKNRDISSCPFSLEQRRKKDKPFSSYKLSKRISANSSNCRSGFVPYKRCFSQQNAMVSSTEMAEEREKRSVRLCL